MYNRELPLVFELDHHREMWESAVPLRVERWLSPTGRYSMSYQVRLIKSAYDDEIGCCEIVDQKRGKLVAKLTRENHTKPQFAWLQRQSGEILIWASTYECGYEIVNFGTHSLVHVDETDGHHFIWTDCVLSPDEKRLAIDGCHWACPYEIQILDVSSDPPAFPLRELAVFPLVGGKLRWIDNETIGEFKEYQELSRHILGEFSPVKTLRTWQAWGDTDGGITFVPAERIPQLRKAGILNDQAELRHTVTAATGEQAMMQHYMLMGWPSYKPQGEKKSCPNRCGGEYYPQGYGDCPNCGHIA